MTLEQQLSDLRLAPPSTLIRGTLLGAGLVEGFSLFDSPIGSVAVTFNTEGVSAVELAAGDFVETLTERLDRPVDEASPPSGWRAKIERAIERGRPNDLPVDLRAVTEFQRQVLTITASIPYGEVRPYGWLASQVGNPGAVRAVGSTMARNPVPLIIPCHRVVRSDGHIGNYSLGGPDRKVVLLSHEGIDLTELERLANRGVRFIASDTTGVFCHPTCRHARRITSDHRVEFASITQAGNAGYRGCKVCRPQ